MDYLITTLPKGTSLDEVMDYDDGTNGKPAETYEIEVHYGDTK